VRRGRGGELTTLGSAISASVGARKPIKVLGADDAGNNIGERFGGGSDEKGRNIVATSTALDGRCHAAFCKHACTASASAGGTSARNLRRGAGSSVAIRANVARADAPSKAA
jgi:hypothetical protein